MPWVRSDGPCCPGLRGAMRSLWKVGACVRSLHSQGQAWNARPASTADATAATFMGFRASRSPFGRQAYGGGKTPGIGGVRCLTDSNEQTRWPRSEQTRWSCSRMNRQYDSSLESSNLKESREADVSSTTVHSSYQTFLSLIQSAKLVPASSSLTNLQCLW